VALSKRKEGEIRKFTKETLAGLKKAWKNIIAKADAGDTLRDEDLRFLRNIPDLIETLEARIGESLEKEIVLPEGMLKNFVEREWKLNEICKDRGTVIEASGYYRCIKGCGELHKKGEECIYLQYQKMKESNVESKDLEEENSNGKCE